MGSSTTSSEGFTASTASSEGSTASTASSEGFAASTASNEGLAAATSELLEDLCLKLIGIDAPSWYLNPQFTIVLAPGFSEISSTTVLEFAPNTFATLSSPQPPSIEFFKSLPSPKPGVWAVYSVILRDPDGNLHAYTGSGTNAVYGCTVRTNMYLDKKHPKLPRFIRQAYDRGYERVHIGMLCWAPLPSPAFVPRARLYFFCLEAVFTCIFFTSFKTIMEPLWEDIVPWKRDEVSWGTLNSHIPLTEGVGDSLNLPPEELERIAAARKHRVSENSKAYEKREREKDLAAHLLRKRTEKKAWAARNVEKVAATHAKVLAKIKSEGRFTCNVCDIPLASSLALKNHLKTQRHMDCVALKAGVPQAPPSEVALRARSFTALAKAEKRYYCSICDHAFASSTKLKIHKKTKGHLKRAAALLDSSESSA